VRRGIVNPIAVWLRIVTGFDGIEDRLADERHGRFHLRHFHHLPFSRGITVSERRQDGCGGGIASDRIEIGWSRRPWPPIPVACQSTHARCKLHRRSKPAVVGHGSGKAKCRHLYDDDVRPPLTHGLQGEAHARKRPRCVVGENHIAHADEPQ